MKKIVIIDDEPLARSMVTEYLQDYPGLQIMQECNDGFEGVKAIMQHQPDLIFLDIKMPDISGLELMASLPGAPMVIFTTAFSEHAVQSFELDAVDYLLKPFSEERFLKACKKARTLQEMLEKSAKADAPDYIIIKSGYEQYKLQLQEILFLESAGNYISFVTKDNKKILSRMSMQEALALLPVARFTRVHRSFIVSNDKVTKADRNNLYMGNISIPIGAAYAEAVNLTLR